MSDLFTIFHSLLQEKEMLMSDEVGKDPQTNAALQRRHASYEHELVALGAQVG